MNWLKQQCSTIKITWNVNRRCTYIYVFLRIFQGVIPSLYVVAYSKFIDNVLKLYSNELTASELLPVFLWITVLSLFKYFSGNLGTYIAMKLKLDMFSELKSKSIEKRSKLKYELIEDKDSWDLIHRTSAGIPNEIAKGFFSLFDLIELVIKVSSLTIILAAFSGMLSAVMIACFVPIILVSFQSGEENYDSFVEFQKVQRRVDNYEKILVSKEYSNERKVFNYSNWIWRKWEKSFTQASKVLIGVKKRNYIKVKRTSIIVMTIFLFIAFVLMRYTVNGTITIGLFTATVMQLIQLGSNISWSLSSTIFNLANTNRYMKDYIAFNNLEEVQPSERSVSIDKVDSIQFNNLSFRYPEAKEYTLKNLNLFISKGETYALVGENGAGKSTLMKLLLKLYDNYEGEILINGVELRNIKDTSKLFGVVFQDFAKYEISIAENILFGEVNEAQEFNLQEGLRRLNFHVSSDRFPKGVRTELGRLSQRNTDLSIGQWQKLAMIRALESQGEFYILDEPTASLDPISEADIYRDFIDTIEGKSSIIITHRLGAARIADTIIVLHKGEIVEMGSHEELENRNGIYNEMFQKQRRWYIDEEKEVSRGNAS